MNKELLRLRKLAGLAESSPIVDHLYEAYSKPNTDALDHQGPLKGLEGPFTMKNGREVYYDPKEGKYYDRRADMYLSDKEAASLTEDAQYVPSVVLHARRGDETLKLRLESMMEMRPMVSMLKNNGYDDFEVTDTDGEDRMPVDSMDDLGDENPDGEMARSQLDTIRDNIERLCNMVDDGTELPAWVQSKLTMAADYLDTATDYLDSESPVDPDSADGSIDDFSQVDTDNDIDVMPPREEGVDKKAGRKAAGSYGRPGSKEQKRAASKASRKLGKTVVGEEDESKKEIEKKITDLQAKKVQTNGHGRRATLQNQIDELKAKLKQLDEGKEDKASIQKQIDDLVKQRVDTAGHGRRATIQNKIDALKDKLKSLDESQVTERKLTADEKEKLEDLKKKHDAKGGMKDAMKKQYPDNWEEVYYGKLTKMAKEDVTEGLDTSKKYKKGDEVMYKGKEMYVVVPDGPTDLVGISSEKDGKPDMVKASELKKEDESKAGEAKEKADEKEEVSEGQNTYGGWKAALRKKYGKVEIEGDKDIAQAWAIVDGKRQGVGEWDGVQGHLEEAAVDATLFGNNTAPFDAVDNQAQKDERTGRADRTGTKNKVPSEVMTAINKRITELKKSVERYDNKGYNEKGVKHNAIECLEQIKKNLARGDHEGFMEAQIFFGTLMSPIWDMFPAQLVNYLAKGSDSE